MIGLAVALVVLPFPGLARLAAPEAAVLSPGTVLEMAPPRALPCRRFQTVELLVEKAPGSPSGADPAAVAWHAAGRDWRFDTRAWHPPPAPLDARAFPRRVQLLMAGAATSVFLTFYCQRFELTMQDELLHDAEPFLGVRWSCTPDGCATEVGYPLGAAVARSPQRLRLCAEAEPDASRDGTSCDLHHRDIRPAFDDQARALALADAIRADAQRTLAVTCEAVHGCGTRATDIRRLLRPVRREVTAFQRLPNEITLEAAGTEKLTLHCSAGDDGLNASCNLQLHGADGRLLLEYLPINDEDVPEAYLDLEGAGWAWLYAPLPTGFDKAAAGARVGGGLLPTAQ